MHIKELQRTYAAMAADISHHAAARSEREALAEKMGKGIG